MNKTLKYILNIFIFTLIAGSLYAQKGTLLPSAVRIGTDVGFAGVSLFDPDKQQFEISTDIDVHKFFLTADYGVASWDINKSDYSYNNSGSYYKLGVDFNLIARDLDLNVIFFGMKYANSHFTEDLNYSINDPFYQDYDEQIHKSGMSAYWIEANLGMKIRVWKQLYLGWAGRLKFARKIQANVTSFDTFYIPGYGKAESDSRWGFNYQIFYRIPFRDKPPYKPKKIKETIDPADTVTDN